MTAAEILAQIEPLGAESYRKVLRKHGIPDPMYGVKVDELKKIQKRVKKDYQLALDLYATGIYDAMYLAGLIADDHRMTPEDLGRWVEGAHCHAIAESTVAWVAAESNHGREVALEWIESDRETTAATGWATLSSLVAIKDDSELSLPELKKLLKRVQKSIHKQPNRVRAAMNGFVIAVGSYVEELSDLAVETGTAIGPVTVDVGDTACKVPYSPDYIGKAQQKGTVGKKRKTAKC